MTAPRPHQRLMRRQQSVPKGVAGLIDEMMLAYANIVYNGNRPDNP
jgi:hypothetical protein